MVCPCNEKDQIQNYRNVVEWKDEDAVALYPAKNSPDSWDPVE